MNRLATLIATGTIAVAAATVTLPASAQEFYVVHPNGQITREYTHHNRAHVRTYLTFSFGNPGFWFRDSYPYAYRHYRAHEWHERRERHHWRDRNRDRHHRRFDHGSDDD